MALSIEITEFGGPEQLRLVDRDPPPPAAGEVRVRHSAIGVNFVDIYHRSGLYPLTLPFTPGVEGAGVVEAVGEAVDGLAPGDRVAYAGTPLGGYAQVRNLPAARAMKLPGDIADDVAAAGLLRGLTVQLLLSGPRPVAPGSTILVHAAAGGLGQMLIRWAKRLGVTTIGTVGTEDKARIAREAGASAVIVGRDADFAARVLDLTGGKGVDIAYDGVGGDYLRRTFDAVAEFGMVATVGQAGGLPPPVPVTDLTKRSLMLWRPSVMLYIANDARYRAAAAEVLSLLASGEAPVRIGAKYPLKDAARAHTDLEAGRTTGSLLLRP